MLSSVHWVRPELVFEVKYLTWTEDGLLRQVVYEGVREDKPTREVARPQTSAPSDHFHRREGGELTLDRIEDFFRHTSNPITNRTAADPPIQLTPVSKRPLRA